MDPLYTSADRLESQSQTTVAVSIGFALAAIVAFFSPTIALLVLFVFAGILLSKFDKYGIAGAALVVPGINAHVVASTLPQLSVGMIQAATTFLVLGYAFGCGGLAKWTSPWVVLFRLALLLLLVLSYVSSADSRSFAVHGEYAQSSLLVWVFILVSAFAISGWTKFSWKTLAYIQSALSVLVFLYSTQLMELGANEIWVARVVALGAILVFAVPNIHFLARLGIGVPLVVFAFLLGKEGPIAALAIGLVVTMLVWSVKHQKRGKVPTVVVVWILLLAWFVLVPWRDVVSVADEGSSVSIRTILLENSISTFLDSPLLGLFVTSPPTPGIESTYPHNVVAEVLVSWGLVGMVFWAVCMVSAMVCAFRESVAPVFVVAVIFALFSGDLSSNPEYWLLGAAGVATVVSASSGRVGTGSRNFDPRRNTQSRTGSSSLSSQG